MRNCDIISRCCCCRCCWSSRRCSPQGFRRATLRQQQQHEHRRCPLQRTHAHRSLERVQSRRASRAIQHRRRMLRSGSGSHSVHLDRKHRLLLFLLPPRRAADESGELPGDDHAALAARDAHSGAQHHQQPRPVETRPRAVVVRGQYVRTLFIRLYNVIL